MAFIRHTLRRNRKNLKIIGWAAVGFILLFCGLTVQLSTTQGQSPMQFPPSRRLPALARTTFEALEDSTPLHRVEKPASNFSVLEKKPAFFARGEARQASHTFPASSAGVDSIAPPAPYAYPSTPQHFVPDPAASPNAIYLQQQPGMGEAIYSKSQAMPRSNYFGVGPDDVCDEWSGYCDCQQKMFTRRGEVCSDKDCRLKRGRKSDDCGCGN